MILGWLKQSVPIFFLTIAVFAHLKNNNEVTKVKISIFPNEM